MERPESYPAEFGKRVTEKVIRKHIRVKNNYSPQSVSLPLFSPGLVAKLRTQDCICDRFRFLKCKCSLDAVRTVFPDLRSSV